MAFKAEAYFRNISIYTSMGGGWLRHNVMQNIQTGGLAFLNLISFVLKHNENNSRSKLLDTIIRMRSASTGSCC